MEEKKKKDRSANFSINEIDLLCSLIIKYASKIECKKTDAITWKEKDNAWGKLTNEFNNKTNEGPRTLKGLKTKYEGFKKELRKKVAAQKLEIFKTGGGSKKEVIFTPNEEKILNIILPSVEGLPSCHDDDSDLNVSNSNEESICQTSEYHTYINTSQDENVEIIYDAAPVSESFPELHEKNSWDKWNPTQLRRRVSKPLQGNRKRKLSKVEASENIVLLASSKKALLDLQHEALLLDIEFKKKDQELQLKKREAELENAILAVEINKLEKEIKMATLNRITNISL